MEFSASIQEIIDEAPETRTLRFDRPAQLMFAPGQFLKVVMNVLPQGRVQRAYSIASSPLDTELDLTIKKFAGGRLSPILVDCSTVGQLITMKGPFGRFVLEQRPMIWIAGGSGIVPFRSMWRYIEQQNVSPTFRLLYSIKNAGDIIYKAELENLRQRTGRVFYTFTAGHPEALPGFEGRVTIEMLRTIESDFDDILFYACGPPAMCDRIASDLQLHGVDRTQIRLERYD